MMMPVFTAERSFNQVRTPHGSRNKPDILKHNHVVPMQGRCPPGCYEANHACYGLLVFNTCWCPEPGFRDCQWDGGDWLAGLCFGYWNLPRCIPNIPRPGGGGPPGGGGGQQVLF
jgi:hypothetical protein